MKKEKIGKFSKENYTATNKEKYKATFKAPGAKILVVDDVKINLAVVKGLLKQTEINIDTALSGSECLKKVAGEKYDLILLDHMMPEMDGMETLRLMQKDPDNQNRNTPVIMQTANAILGAREEYLESGFTDYISKPIRWEELEAIIVKYVAKEKLLSIKE